MTTEGSDGEKFEVSAVVRAVLEETRHSVTLHPAVKKSSLTYIMGFAMGEDAEEVKASMPTEPAEWMAEGRTEMCKVLYTAGKWYKTSREQRER